MDKDKIKQFSVSVYGNLEQYNQVLSKARCRTFYKSLNRNGTYITDEFADKLLSTIPYTPVKGIFNQDEHDYEDHGKERTEGRIYGIVPENPNFAWEKHLDEDGVERDYACVDVLLFTGIYPEASEIVGKSQSMELYAPSIKGDWGIKDGQKCFIFEDACFLGLQVLGDNVEPCFEGAAFFSLYNSIKELIENNTFSIKEEKGEENMINFRLSDGAKHEAIWNLLNTNYNEEGNWTVDYCICDIYDEYCVAYNYEEQSYERIYYTKENDVVELGARKKCYIIDVTEEEKISLETIQALNNNTYEKIEENFVSKEEVEQKTSEFEQKIEENVATIATLNSEKEEISNALESQEAELNSLKEENESLKQFKLEQERLEKRAIVDKYSERLSEEIIEKYTDERIAEFTAKELDKELAFELVSNDPTVFSNNNNNLIPKDEPRTGVEAILEKYRK